ncbi:MAG: sulfur oxidation c-type cytochrome SoxX [Pseudomonadota bacterium]
MNEKIALAAAVAAASALALVTGGCSAPGGDKPATKPAAATPAKPDYAKLSPQALAEHLVFESGSYDLNQPTQEGTTGRARLTQDETMKICSEIARTGKELDAAAADRIRAAAQASIKYPEGGIKLGDWKVGRELAWSGFGFRTAHNPDKHEPGRAPGANCYNCHTLAEDRTGGTLGPSLTGYGKLRGNSPEVLKYTYDVIYNAHAYFACTSMPRMGANGVLTQEQIADVMAYLFDPASPVNK